MVRPRARWHRHALYVFVVAVCLAASGSAAPQSFAAELPPCDGPALLRGLQPSASTSDCPTISGPIIVGTYRGTMAVKIRVFNVYGQFMGDYIYRSNVAVVIDQPYQTPFVRENNPFHLTISSDPASTAVGNITVESAAVADPRLILRYWSLGINTTTNRFSGQMQANVDISLVGWNTLNVPRELVPGSWFSFPVTIGNGTTLQGAYNDNALAIAMSGNATDLGSPFYLELNATRVTANVPAPITRPLETPQPQPTEPLRSTIYLPVVRR